MTNFFVSYYVLEYLKDDHRDKLHRPLPLKEWDFATPTHPVQDNGMDCGLFVCTFAEYVSRNAALNFDHTYMPFFRQLLAYKLTIKQLISIDANETNIEEFINRVINNN